jgi:hypothetical protein
MRWQWQAMEVDRTAQDHPLAVTTTALHQGSATRAVKTQGTNCAFRAGALRAAGGFDPVFRFYLDEADVNLRLAQGGLTAVVPDAVVHHGYLPSRRRRADRVPTDLSDIAASLAHFLRRHAPGADHAALIAAEAARQRARLVRHMVAGRLEPRDVGRIMATFDPGPPLTITELAARPPGRLPFAALPTRARPGVVLRGRSRSGLLARAAALSGTSVVTALCDAPALRRRRQSFVMPGLWLVEGRGASDGEIARLSAFRPTAP